MSVEYSVLITHRRYWILQHSLIFRPHDDWLYLIFAWNTFQQKKREVLNKELMKTCNTPKERESIMLSCYFSIKNTIYIPSHILQFEIRRLKASPQNWQVNGPVRRTFERFYVFKSKQLSLLFLVRFSPFDGCEWVNQWRVFKWRNLHLERS